ncbi:MAG: PIG-L deacetylase family protein [Acidimicrobiales bacterium]
MTDLGSFLHTTHDEPIPSRVLVVVAHPDDIDFGSAGTIATFTDHGVEVIYGLVTDGDAGEPAHLSPPQLREIRHAEQAAAAKIVGVTELHWLGAKDGAVVADLELRRCVSRLIRTVRPDLVITQSPVRDLDRIYAAHPDHLAVGEATTCAVYPDSRNTHSFPELLHEGLEPHAVHRLWLMGGPAPNVFVDIAHNLDRKVEALLAHDSQNGSRAEHLPALITDWAGDCARRSGLDGQLVEAFRSIDTR